MRLPVQQADPADPAGPAERFAIALDLAETGIALMRQNLRRRHPDASEKEIDGELHAWLGDRPPDCPGRPRAIPAA